MALDYNRCRTIAHGYARDKNWKCEADWWQKAADRAPDRAELEDCLIRKDCCELLLLAPETLGDRGQ